MSVRRTLLAVAVLAMQAGSAAAQQWNAEAQVGRVRSALDPAAIASTSALLGLRYEDTHSALRAIAGVPTGSEQPLWGALAVARRLAPQKNGWIGGIDLTAHGLLVHDRAQRTREIPRLLLPPAIIREPGMSGFALAGQALPLVAYTGTRLQAHARAGVSYYTNKFGTEESSRTVQLADAQLTFAPNAHIALGPAVRRYHTEEGQYSYAGVSGALSQGPVNAWLNAGQWFGFADAPISWAFGAALRVHPRLDVTASARDDAFDPLFLTPAQKSWSIGVALHKAVAPAPVAPLPAAYVDGRATIRLPISRSSGATRIAGDFNGWKPQPMNRSGDNWTYSVPLSKGVYNYAFVNEQGEWFVPEKHPGRKEDGMGGHVAVLVVQ